MKLRMLCRSVTNPLKFVNVLVCLNFKIEFFMHVDH